MKVYLNILIILTISTGSCFSATRYQRTYQRAIGGEFTSSGLSTAGYTTFAKAGGGVGWTGNVCSKFTLFSEFQGLIDIENAISYLKNAAVTAAGALLEKAICSKDTLICAIFRGNRLLTNIRFQGKNKRCMSIIQAAYDASDKAAREKAKDCIRHAKSNTQAVQDCGHLNGYKLGYKFLEPGTTLNMGDLNYEWLGNGKVSQFAKDTFGEITVTHDGLITSQYAKRKRLLNILQDEKIAAENEGKQIEKEKEPADQLVTISKNALKDPAHPDGQESKADTNKHHNPHLTHEQANEIVNTIHPDDVAILKERLYEKTSEMQTVMKLMAIQAGLEAKLMDSETLKNDVMFKRLSMQWTINQKKIENLIHLKNMKSSYQQWLNKVVEATKNEEDAKSQDLKRSMNRNLEKPGGISP